MWLTQKYICEGKSKITNKWKKKYFIDSIHSFDKRKYLDSSRQYLKWTLWHTDRWKVFKMVTI